MELTKVIFRRWKTGDKEVIAMFPDIDESHSNYAGELVSSYEHIGQHGAADYWQMLNKTIPAKLTDPDVIELKAELEQIGYNLEVRKRRS